MFLRGGVSVCSWKCKTVKIWYTCGGKYSLICLQTWLYDKLNKMKLLMDGERLFRLIWIDQIQGVLYHVTKILTFSSPCSQWLHPLSLKHGHKYLCMRIGNKFPTQHWRFNLWKRLSFDCIYFQFRRQRAWKVLGKS